VNKQTIALIGVAVVAAIAAILVLLPSEGPVTVPKTTAEGTATVSPSGSEMSTQDVRVPAAPVPPSRTTLTRSGPAGSNPDAPRLTAGLEGPPGNPLDVHGQKDSHIWIGIYRMMVRDNGGSTDLAERVHTMGNTVGGVTSANDLASYTELFNEERKLLAEVRASSSNPQILANCDSIEAAVNAVQAGQLHPADNGSETADAAGAP
jgi:hypothetical protein